MGHFENSSEMHLLKYECCPISFIKDLVAKRKIKTICCASMELCQRYTRAGRLFSCYGAGRDYRYKNLLKKSRKARGSKAVYSQNEMACSIKRRKKCSLSS
ncbi:unnamed protein product [Moneuplotes crassus]|uniref:Uncharacterized protein n=1 Tax=Euplotes crassus TaxID=5936 RepID=A0AAD1UER1_EUPCR|nr:unnamed protein product [Moneuplotes crassus]